jgi:hypothetical protein
MKLHFGKYVCIALTCVLFSFLLVDSVFAGKLSQIRLDDGSSIQAEVMSFSNGIYVLNSPSLGSFELSEDKIISIQMFGKTGLKRSSQSSFSDNDRSSTAVSSSNSDSQVSQFRNQLTQDPETMQMIQNLQNDPSVKQILNDKDLMKAINGQDLGVVASDPKIKSFANSEAFRAILEKSR